MIRKAMVCMMASAVFSMFGCSAEDQVPTVKATAEPGKILVAYYSWSGNTRAAAEQIQKATGGTLFEIKPVKPYSTDHSSCLAEARRDMQTNTRPELSSNVDNMAKYDVIFVGSPNWMGTIAPPVTTFLTTSILKGKTVIPFFTHGGGGVQNCERDFRKLCPDSKLAKAGVFFGGSVSRSGDAIVKWVNESITINQ